jgi:hypothetical protein
MLALVAQRARGSSDCLTGRPSQEAEVTEMDMSETVSRGQESGPRENIPAAAAQRGRRALGRWIAAGMVVAVAASLVWVWRAGALSTSATPGTGQGAAAPATAVVTRQNISATTPVTATLGYAGSYTVLGQGSGTLTWLPSAGQVIRQGQALYKVDDGVPVVLLYGSVPAWRGLYEGVTGHDVSQLNRDLVSLGYANRATIASLGWDYDSWETADAVQLLEEHLEAPSPSGSLPLGQLVFEPEALRVSQVIGNLGDPASSISPASGTAAPANAVLTATADRHVVTIPLDASQQSEVRAGDAVNITLPNGTSTPGVVSSVGTVATTAQGADGTPTTTIPVQVTLLHPAAAGTLDQAPVTVYLTTATASDALTVPVTALLAQPGRYVVEVVGPGSTRQYVPVTTGIVDSADGLVQVSGALTPGERIVVAAS